MRCTLSPTFFVNIFCKFYVRDTLRHDQRLLKEDEFNIISTRTPLIKLSMSYAKFIFKKKVNPQILGVSFWDKNYYFILFLLQRKGLLCALWPNQLSVLIKLPFIMCSSGKKERKQEATYGIVKKNNLHF